MQQNRRIWTAYKLHCMWFPSGLELGCHALIIRGMQYQWRAFVHCHIILSVLSVLDKYRHASISGVTIPLSLCRYGNHGFRESCQGVWVSPICSINKTAYAGPADKGVHLYMLSLMGSPILGDLCQPIAARVVLLNVQFF